MRIFVTGASGWIGSAVSEELLSAGHEVVGLARSDESAAALSSSGLVPLRGNLDDLDSLRSGAESADGVIHLGFKHDFSDFAGAGRTERAVVQTFLDVLEGTDRPFLLASGVAFPMGRLLTEDDASPAIGPDSPRGGSEALAISYADKGVRSVGLRFSPTTHGAGDHGFMARLVEIARDRGTASYIGDGANRWPAVDRRDAARLVALALAGSEAGTVVHAVAEEGIATRDIAAAIGAGLGLPVTSIAEDDAGEHFGWIAGFFGLDVPASSTLTQERLGWTPTGPTLAEELKSGSYFADPV